MLIDLPIVTKITSQIGWAGLGSTPNHPNYPVSLGILKDWWKIDWCQSILGKKMLIQVDSGLQFDMNSIWKNKKYEEKKEDKRERERAEEIRGITLVF